VHRRLAHPPRQALPTPIKDGDAPAGIDQIVQGFGIFLDEISPAGDHQHMSPFRIAARPMFQPHRPAIAQRQEKALSARRQAAAAHPRVSFGHNIHGAHR
jgi:hypothetical protein